MKIAFCVFVLLCLTYVSIVSSIQTPKSCAEYKIAPMQGFVKEGYLGFWFAHQLYDFPGYDCYVELRTPRSDGNADVSDILFKPNGTIEFNSLGTVTYDYPGEGRYVYYSAGSVFSGKNGYEYVVLKTDYVTYGISCRCTDVIGGSSVEFYVSSRFPIVPSFIQDEINKVIKDHGFDSNEIITMDILSCPSKLIGGVGLLAGVLKLVTYLLRVVLRLVGGLVGAVGGLLG